MFSVNYLVFYFHIMYLARRWLINNPPMRGLNYHEASFTQFTLPSFSLLFHVISSHLYMPLSAIVSFRDVQSLGVNLLGHQRKIVKAAQQLRTHLTQGQVEVWGRSTSFSGALLHYGICSPWSTKLFRTRKVHRRRERTVWEEKKCHRDVVYFNLLPLFLSPPK